MKPAYRVSCVNLQGGGRGWGMSRLSVCASRRESANNGGWCSETGLFYALDRGGIALNTEEEEEEAAT